MKRFTVGILLVTLIFVQAAMADGRKDRPGRPVKVAAIPIGFGGEHDAKLKVALDRLEIAGKAGADIACLPEEFCGYDKGEPMNGPITTACAEVAKKYKMYVICPIREQADKDHMYNTAVIIDRSGKIIDWYRKVFVFWNEGLNLSEEGVKTFDLDFGRISVFTCFDINFSELWSEADIKGADIVFWPSAYGGGMPLTGYAMSHNYYIVPVGKGNMIDITGQPVTPVDKPRDDVFIATLDLDRTIIHRDDAAPRVEKMLKEHKGELEIEQTFDTEYWYLFRSLKPGVLVRGLLKEYKQETLREYRHRSRDAINEAPKQGKRILES